MIVRNFLAHVVMLMLLAFTAAVIYANIAFGTESAQWMDFLRRVWILCVTIPAVIAAAIVLTRLPVRLEPGKTVFSLFR
jgi:hypothetical protein